jgi:hypothetical protein
LRKPWLLAVLASGCLATSAFADVSMTLTGVGQGNVMAGVYTSPYTGTIDGMPTTIICDDFADDSFMNESWKATVSTVANLVAPRFGLQQQSYDAAAALSIQLLQTSDPTQLGYLSYAIWDVFSDSNVKTYLGASNTIYTTAHSMAQNALSQTYAPGQFSNVLVYTAIAGTATGCPGASCPVNSPQEFLVVTPEPPAPALLAVYLSSLAGLIFLFRRRVVLRG